MYLKQLLSIMHNYNPGVHIIGEKQSQTFKSSSGKDTFLYLVTEAPTAPFLSWSTIIRFLDNCSWIRMTFSWPFTIKYPPVYNNTHRIKTKWILKRDYNLLNCKCCTVLCTWIQGTFIQLWKLQGSFSCEDTIWTFQHDWHPEKSRENALI